MSAKGRRYSMISGRLPYSAHPIAVEVIGEVAQVRIRAELGISSFTISRVAPARGGVVEDGAVHSRSRRPRVDVDAEQRARAGWRHGDTRRRLRGAVFRPGQGRPGRGESAAWGPFRAGGSNLVAASRYAGDREALDRIKFNLRRTPLSSQVCGDGVVAGAHSFLVRRAAGAATAPVHVHTVIEQKPHSITRKSPG